MLSFVFRDTDNMEYILNRPLQMHIRMDEAVPADDVEALFAYERVGELTTVSIYDGVLPVFLGVVDEQERLISEQGRFLRISARSLAACLLDNEAMPQSYDHPSAALIYERHVQPYGIRWENEDDATYFGEQSVTKGMSQWTVLKNFCNACYSSAPRVTADGRLLMKGTADPQSVVFSDGGEGKTYYEISEVKKRCEEISRVNVKVSDTDGYSYVLDNADAVRRGVRRERYLNAVLSSTPMTCADTMILRGQANSYSLMLKCGGCLIDAMGSGATVRNRWLGTVGDLYVSAVNYRMDENGDTTALQLKRRVS